MQSQFKKYLTPYLTAKNIAAAFVVVVVLGIVLISVFSRQEEQAPVAEAPAAPLAEKPCIPTPGTGKQSYSVMTDNPKGFMITELAVDPIDVEVGGTQTITVKVKDVGNNTITKRSGVKATIKTDNKDTAAAAFVLRLAEDSQDGSSLLVTWEGSWIRDDSVCHTYMETITAVNDKGDKHSVDVAFK